jgi:hypothetical protein
MNRRLLSLVAFLSAVWPAAAQAEGGLKPSQAPQVQVGQHYFGSTAHPPNNGGFAYDLWRLPALLAGDVISVAWNEDPTQLTSLCVSDDVDDFNWSQYTCNASPEQATGGSHSARSIITSPRTSPNAFLEFWNDYPSSRNGGAYDFTVESIQHKLGVDLKRISSVSRRGTVTVRAVLANGAAVPDGLGFTLRVRWRGGKAAYRATSRAGQLRFRLRLPRSARAKTASLTVSRPADPGYLTGRSSSQRVRVR